MLSCYGWTYLVGSIFWWSMHCLVVFVVAIAITERGDRGCWFAELAFVGSLYLVSRVGITAKIGVSI